MEPGAQHAAPLRLAMALTVMRTTGEIRRALTGDHQNAARTAPVTVRNEAPERRFRRALGVAVQVEDCIDRKPAAPGEAVEFRIAGLKRMLGAAGEGSGLGP